MMRPREAIMTHTARDPTTVGFAYKSDNDYSLQVARWILLPIGAWPRPDAATIVLRLSLHVHVLVTSCLIAVIMVPCLLYVSLEETDIQAILISMGPLSHFVVGIINYWVLVARSGELRECMRHMETDWRLARKLEDREVMLRHARLGRMVAGFCAVFMQFGTFLFVIPKSLSTVVVVVDNATVTTHPMSCATYSKMIDTRYSPVNEIMLIVQSLSMFIVNSVTVGVCSLDAIFAMHAHGQLSMLFSWMDELVADVKRNGSIDRKLAVIVEHHLRALSFISRMENVMQQICLMELLECTMNMCLLAYYFITNWGIFDAAKTTSFVLIYLSMAFNIFIFCYIGEMLTEQCKNVGEKAYTINWYELPHQTALSLILIIARSNNVIKLTAGKLVHLSIATFGDVIKTSMVYLNLIRTMTYSKL